MDVRMYNVEFGESILMTEDGQTPLLIDFGSKDTTTLPAVDNDVAGMNLNALDLLITHFHDDHTNGIYENREDRLFDKVQDGIVYMPSLLEMQRVPAHFSCLRIETVLDFLDAIREGQNFHGKLYQIFTALNNRHRHVVFLQRGVVFTACGVDCQVLWPDFDIIAQNTRIKEQTVTKIINQLVAWEGRLSNATRQHILGLDIPMPDAPEAHPQSILLAVIDAYNDMLVHAFHNMMNVLPDDFRNLQALNHALSVIAADIAGTLNAQDRKVIRDSINNLVDQKNRVSIVFHDIPHNDSSRFLMTGDFKKEDYKYISDPQNPPSVSGQYQLIKAPHHGTDSHFIPTLPQCRDIIISNGDGNSGHGKIAYGYGALYHSNRGNTTIHCTNQRCELFLSNPGFLPGINQPCAGCPGHQQDSINIRL